MKIKIKKEVFNEKYIPLLRNKKRYIFIMGGAGSGKSVFEAQNEIIKTFEKGNKLLVIRKVKETHKDSTYSELVNVIDKWKLRDYFTILKSPLEIRNNLTGSSIIFRGMDNNEKIKSIQGVNRIWIEEATELSNEDFNQLDLRLRGKKNMQIVCTFNPIDKDSWLNTRFWQYGSNEDVELVHTTYLDNKFVGEEYKKVMERLKEQDPAYYKIYALGEWGNIEGLVFEKQPTIIESIPEEAKLLGYGLDFGFTNDPTALVGIYKYNGGIILDEMLYRTGMRNIDIINYLNSNNVDKESIIIADSAEPKSIEDIYMAGFNIKPAVKGKDSVINGINLMKEYKLYITANSTNGIKEFKKYVWQKDKNGKRLNKPIDGFNHFIDAARYGMTGLLKQYQEKTFDIFIR